MSELDNKKKGSEPSYSVDDSIYKGNVQGLMAVFP